MLGGAAFLLATCVIHYEHLVSWCVCGGYVLGEEVRGGFYADGFAWSGEGWGTSWGMGAFCVPAVGGWVLVFSIAVIAPHEHSTHEHPNLWGVERRGFKGCISRCSTG